MIKNINSKKNSAENPNKSSGSRYAMLTSKKSSRKNVTPTKSRQPPLLPPRPLAEVTSMSSLEGSDPEISHVHIESKSTKHAIPESSGDAGSISPDLTSAQASKCNMQMGFVWFFEVYSAICFIFFTGTACIWGTVYFHKLRYFIRLPNTAFFFSVESGTTWRVFRLLIGSLMHFILTIWTVVLLIGTKALRKELAKYKEKILAWIVILAACGEFLILDSTLEYYISQPEVLNGEFLDTILPPPASPDTMACINPSYARDHNLTTNPTSKFVRVNLKWFTQVLCKPQSLEDESIDDKPLWERFLTQSKIPSQIQQACHERDYSLRDAANDDCHTAHLLEICCSTWAFLGICGLAFCIALLRLHSHVTVKTVPYIRLSFTKVEDEKKNDDIEGSSEL